jgi:polyhydroxyalkanoate synthesis regulator phasin
MDAHRKDAEHKNLPEIFREAWAQALSAMSSAEDEAHKALTRVQDLVEWSPEELKRNAREFAERLTGQRKELEHNLEQGVSRALGRIKLPRREDVEALRQRALSLSARVDALARRRRS